MTSLNAIELSKIYPHIKEQILLDYFNEKEDACYAEIRIIQMSPIVKSISALPFGIKCISSYEAENILNKIEKQLKAKQN